MARSLPLSCSVIASTIWKRQSSASQDGIRLIRMRRSGPISPVRTGWAARLHRSWKLEGAKQMAHFTIKLPDVGEGVAEAELVEWHVKVGDVVREDDLLAAVMTDKATVEIPSSRAGKVIAINGEVGEKIAVGSELVRLEIEGGSQEEKAEEKPVPAA